MRDVRISEEGNVGDAVIADEEISFYQMVFHDLQRGPAAVALGSQERCFLWGV